MINAAQLNAALRDYFIDILRPDSELSDGPVVQVATPGPEPTLPDSPPVVVPSFAEMIESALMEQTKALAVAMEPLRRRPEPENMTVIDCYDAAGDDRFLGRMYVDDATGRDYKFVTMSGETIWF